MFYKNYEKIPVKSIQLYTNMPKSLRKIRNSHKQEPTSKKGGYPRQETAFLDDGFDIGQQAPVDRTSQSTRGFPKLNLSQIELIKLIEQISITLGIVKINSCMTSKLPII